MVIPEDGCIPLDADIDLIKVPVVGCRAPTGIGAVINTAQVEPGSTALVVGLGGVGFNVIQGLKLAGAHLIIAADIVDKKQWAMDWGATHYIDSSKQDIVEEVLKITGIGVDYAFDAIGRGDVQSACVAATHKGGRIVWVGVAPHTQKSVDLDAMNMTLYQKTAGGTCYGGASPFEMVPQIMRLYRSGIVKLDQLITEVLQPRPDQRRVLRHAGRQEHLRLHPHGLARSAHDGAGPAMKWFHSETHLLHDPDREVWAGTPTSGSEVPRRAEAIAEALSGDAVFVRGEVRAHGRRARVDGSTTPRWCAGSRAPGRSVARCPRPARSSPTRSATPASWRACRGTPSRRSRRSAASATGASTR